MQDKATSVSHRVLALNTLAFTVCFAAWMLNGVLVTFLSAHQIFDWDPVKIGWLMGIPVLTGSLLRLPAGMLTDRYGGKPIMAGLLFLCAVPMYLLSTAKGFTDFALYSFGFGMAGVSFSIGIAFTSVWYPRHAQGTALGIFGAGNAGAALTTLLAPKMLNELTRDGADPEGWRRLPVYYAIALVATGVLFLSLTRNKKPASSTLDWSRMLSPLANIRVWRFGLYYFLVFGCFVAFSQWLVPYFVNAYYLPLVTAGLLASCFSLPSGVIRAAGGWMSDLWGARKVMYAVLGLSTLISLMLIVPKMEIYSPGRGVVAVRPGTVAEVRSDAVVVDGKVYPLLVRKKIRDLDGDVLILPVKEVWQEPVVVAGSSVQRRELLAKGMTRIYFQANVWVFTVLVLALGVVWGIGKAAVYRYIPDYFPEQVGVVGGMVGVLGGLGGFFCPIVFGYLLEGTGLWTSCWMLMFALSAGCLWWMHAVVTGMMRRRHPESVHRIEH